MKIAYVCYWNMSRQDGVAVKIRSQLDHWRQAGHDAKLFFLTPEQARAGEDGRAFSFAEGRSRIAATARLAAAVRRHRPNLLYLRYDLFMPPLVRAFASWPTVAEFNSNVGAELRARSSRAAVYERLQRRFLLSRLAGAVAVTHELEGALRRQRPELTTTVISNGVDFGPPHAHEGAGSPPRLVYVGEGVYWQGVDKILELAVSFPEWRFDIVGAEPRAAPANVAWHGFMSPDEYAPILARADVGLGTLALHRKQMEEACPLKVRRYLEFGLPVILAYTDTDFVGLDPWWLLRLPNTERNTNDRLASIEAFVDAVKGRRVSRSEVEPLLSAAAKEAARLDFFSRFVRD
jgi:glycosyltransferase involved in cell wall biosynthesis